MATINIEIEVTPAQQAKIKEAAEFAAGRDLTNVQVLRLIRAWVIRHLKQEVKSYLADKRRASWDDSEIENIREAE